MSNTDKLREFGQKVIREYGRWWGIEEKDTDKFLSDLTALISEHYTANEEIEKMVSERQYDVDFGGHLKAGIKVTSSGIEIIGAVNGWGNAVPDGDIIITNIP